MTRHIGALLLLSLVCVSAAAQTRYVTDELEITMRSGESTRNSIVRMLKSGTALEVLAENAETGYTKVRTPAGTEGYVLTRFLVRQPVARQVLPQVQQQLTTLRERQRVSGEQSAELKGENRSLSGERDRLKRDLAKAENELREIRSKAAAVLQIDEQNSSLRARVNTLQAEVEALSQTNADLRGRRSMEWFIAGASVVLLGVILGLVLPKLRINRRSSWGDL